MPAYLMSTDPESGYNDLDAMAGYGATVPGIVESFGGRYLLRRSQTRALEGSWEPGDMVLIEFPSMTELRAFYESEQYRPWLELRQRAGRTNIVITEAA
ncbi:DUF1330 domain-containing protein [Pseudonocardia spinosispora]|uniref:DUF1330 domain-containing protein n=1 Tax=Pseudonocardia spinosispora TaxID=103441 RepID=UPI0012EC8611|nr:DUF1330 domain-containing protein [Pseudonocardia spinosispora]